MKAIYTKSRYSGRDKPLHKYQPRFKNRARLLRTLGKQGSPYLCTGLSPHNRIRTQVGLTADLGIFTYSPESRMYGFVRDTKTNSGHRWPEKPDDPAGLEQPVGGRNKAMPAGGYSAATWWKTTVRQVLFLTETREVLLAVSSRLVRETLL